jgi:hypothetical protein
MNLKHEKFIEEALRRHERGDGFETFLKAHPEVQSEVREMVEIGKRISVLSEHIPVPRSGFEKALRGIHIDEAKPAAVASSVQSPYMMLFTSTYLRFAVPALMVLLIVVGVGVYPDTGVKQTSESADSVAPEMMQMKMMPSSGDAAGASPASFSATSEGSALDVSSSLMATDDISLRTPTIASVDDLVVLLQQEATNEIATLSEGDADFAIATESGAAVLHDFNNVYDESSL